MFKRIGDKNFLRCDRCHSLGRYVKKEHDLVAFADTLTGWNYLIRLIMSNYNICN